MAPNALVWPNFGGFSEKPRNRFFLRAKEFKCSLYAKYLKCHSIFCPFIASQEAVPLNGYGFLGFNKLKGQRKVLLVGEPHDIPEGSPRPPAVSEVISNLNLNMEDDKETYEDEEEEQGEI